MALTVAGITHHIRVRCVREGFTRNAAATLMTNMTKATTDVIRPARHIPAKAEGFDVRCAPLIAETVNAKATKYRGTAARNDVRESVRAFNRIVVDTSWMAGGFEGGHRFIVCSGSAGWKARATRD